jgi:AcrR family transcriptional regulator
MDGKQRAAQARREALIGAAREQIMEHGPEKVSLAEVLRIAGGSKATVVKYFGDREGLVAAAIVDVARDAMRDLALDEAAPDQPPEQGLARMLAGLLRFYLQRESMMVYRSVIATRTPSLAAAFYRGGHEYVVAVLTAFLGKWPAPGLREGLDIVAEADRLTHMLRAGLYEQALIGLIEAPFDVKAIEEQARAVATQFVQGAARRD